MSKENSRGVSKGISDGDPERFAGEIFNKFLKESKMIFFKFSLGG